jgi:ribosome-binding protein aMBF1 (putative translation factor)
VRIYAQRTQNAKIKNLGRSNVTITVAQGVTKIRKFLDSTGMSRAKLADKVGMSKNFLRNLDKPGWCPRPETLDKLLNFIEAHEKKTRPKRGPVRAEFLNA